MQDKINRIRAIQNSDVFEIKVERIRVDSNLDEIKAKVPKLQLNQVTKEFDFYCKKLRIIDGIIQNKNWNVEVDEGDCFLDYTDKPIADECEESDYDKTPDCAQDSNRVNSVRERAS